MPPPGRRMKTAKTPPSSGFTFSELLVAVAVAALLITAAVIGFSTITQAPTRSGRIDVYLERSVLTNFYGPSFTGAYVSMAVNPNYLQAVEARRLKDRFLADVSSATAVFCLGRNSQVSAAQRPSLLVVKPDTDLRTNATPGAFADFLTNTPVLADAAVIFAGNTNGVLAQTNSSLFVLGGLDATVQGGTNQLGVIATYEVDFVPASDPDGTYATVRRYAGTGEAPTDYYHLFYPEESNQGTEGFRPLAAYFARSASSGTPLQVAGATNNRPFSFVWWPDPLSSSLSNRAIVSWTSGAPVRSNYANMAGRTSLFFAVPVFPGL
jgi:prepilin-type N-terminal cleavage/methylation domain-containing protein